MSARSELVLISGLNGFIATDIAFAFLEAGYRVRGTVRSQAKADIWLKLPAFAPYIASGQIHIAFVPDIVKPGAFDVGALRAVSMCTSSTLGKPRAVSIRMSMSFMRFVRSLAVSMCMSRYRSELGGRPEIAFGLVASRAGAPAAMADGGVEMVADGPRSV